MAQACELHVMPIAKVIFKEETQSASVSVLEVVARCAVLDMQITSQRLMPPSLSITFFGHLLIQLWFDAKSFSDCDNPGFHSIGSQSGTIERFD